MHKAAFDFVGKAIREASVQGQDFVDVVEFGSRILNGTPRPHFEEWCRLTGRELNYLGIDVMPGPGVDVIGNPVDIANEVGEFKGKFRPFNADCVVCCSVLEHDPDAANTVACVGKWLKPDGIFILTTVCNPWPAHSAVDGGPLRSGEYYRNITDKEVTAWLGTWATWQAVLQFDTTGDLFAVAKR